jgi:hypothetical protein
MSLPPFPCLAGWVLKLSMKTNGMLTFGLTPCCAAASCTPCTRRCSASAAAKNVNRTFAEWIGLVARSRTPDTAQHCCQEMPPPSDEVFEREVQDFIADVELFLRAECEVEENRRTPVGFEVSFGRGPIADATEPLASNRSHRDRSRPGPALPPCRDKSTASTRSAPRPLKSSTTRRAVTSRLIGRECFAGGRRLQHALYGLAAVELLKRKYPRPTIAGGTYYFSSAKGQQQRSEIPSSGRRRLRSRRCSVICGRSLRLERLFMRAVLSRRANGAISAAPAAAK